MRYRWSWVTLLTCVVCVIMTARLSLADDSDEFASDAISSPIHEHQGWSIVVNPLGVGKINTDLAGYSDAASEYAASMLVSRRLSRAAMLDLGFLTATSDDYGGSTHSFLISLTPKLIVSAPQADRMFFGLGLAVLALDRADEEARWGAGPQATLGVDIGLSRRTCFVFAAEFGIVGLSARARPVPSGPPEVGPLPEGVSDGPSVGWARLVFGLRVSP